VREQVVRDYDAEVILQNLHDFRKIYHALAPQEQAEVLRCLVRDIDIYPDKLHLNIFELAELTPGSQKRIDWLPELYPLRILRFEFPRSRQTV
jgi:hypothetical protein